VARVGQGVFEMNEHIDPGWRMHDVQRGNALPVMLGGGDNSRQQADIDRAIELSISIQE